MDIGIGLPNAVRGVDRAGIVEWARRAEARGFSSLGTIDRIAYPNYESLIALAAAAAVTERIRLVTDILIAPLRGQHGAAGQAGGDDRPPVRRAARCSASRSAGARTTSRPQRRRLPPPRAHASTRSSSELRAPLGRRDGVGPARRAAARAADRRRVATPRCARVARHGDGWTTGGGGPERVRGGAREACATAWQAAGRDGEPRTMALCYFALGDDAEEPGARRARRLLRFVGEYAEQVVAGAADGRGRDARHVAGFERGRRATRSSASRRRPTRRRSTCSRARFSPSRLAGGLRLGLLALAAALEPIALLGGGLARAFLREVARGPRPRSAAAAGQLLHRLAQLARALDAGLLVVVLVVGHHPLRMSEICLRHAEAFAFADAAVCLPAATADISVRLSFGSPTSIAPMIGLAVDPGAQRHPGLRGVEDAEVAELRLRAEPDLLPPVVARRAHAS